MLPIFTIGCFNPIRGEAVQPLSPTQIMPGANFHTFWRQNRTNFRDDGGKRRIVCQKMALKPWGLPRPVYFCGMLPLSKAQIAHIIALRDRKTRYELRQFVIEGDKLIEEASAEGFDIRQLVIRKEHLCPLHNTMFYEIDKMIFRKISTLENPEGSLAVISFNSQKPFCIPAPETLTCGGFVLDAVQDPGNLGTILRIADWFGLGAVVLGPGCVDPLNPKTLRASMGAIFRVPIYTTPDLPAWLAQQPNRLFLADMRGKPLGTTTLSVTDWIILGNEANGVSEALRALPTLQPITIPRTGGAESLNVSVAAGILAWEMQRNG
jgi:TrmH family RNA methyltransferase